MGFGNENSRSTKLSGVYHINFFRCQIAVESFLRFFNEQKSQTDANFVETKFVGSGQRGI